MRTIKSGINRRTLLLGTGAAGITLTLGMSSATRGAATAASTASVRVGVSEDGYRTDQRANIGFYPLNTNIFESLVYLTPEYQIEPRLAELWKFVAPGTWRIALRKGVAFHDGTPFDAKAVKYTMDRIAANGGGVMGIGKDSTVIVEDHTVEITPTYVNMRLMEQIGHPNNSILPVGLNPAQKRNGTGPFREIEYVAADHYTVEANAEYWGKDKPSVKQITFQFYPDPTARMLALQAEDVDLIIDVPRQSANQVEATGASLIKGPVGGYEAMYFNIHGAAPYDIGQDIAVREAVSIAINRQQIIDSAWQGNAEPGTTMIPPAILGDSASLVAAPEFDSERAKQLLETAGWVEGKDGIREKGGKPLKLTIINGYGTAADHGSVPELIQAQLKDIGIDLEIIQTPDTATYEQRLSVGEGDLWLESGSQNDGNPAFLPGLLFSSPEKDGDPESTMYGRAFAPGKEFDTAITTSREAATIAEVQAAAGKAMNIVINEARIVTPLCGFYRLVGHNAIIASFELHASGVNQRWTSLTVAE
jgi:peptide/nickel transport system substrate-binding protein